MYIGGAAGSRVRKGDVLCVTDSHDETVLMMGRFMQYYREHARYLERTYDFVERLGIEHLRQILVEDSEGICVAAGPGHAGHGGCIPGPVARSRRSRPIPTSSSTRPTEPAEPVAALR